MISCFYEQSVKNAILVSKELSQPSNIIKVNSLIAITLKKKSHHHMRGELQYLLVQEKSLC